MKAFKSYENYAYHVSMLRQFVSLSSGTKGVNGNNLDSSGHSDKSIGKVSSVHGGNVWNTFKSSRKMNVRRGDRSTKDLDDSNSRRGVDLSARSQPGRVMRRINTATGALSGMS
jgi:hypothetical protein